MKKEFYKSSNSYTISVIHAPHPENGRINRIKDIDLENTESNKLDCEFNEGCDFETAVKSSEYGKFNWLLLFTTSWGFIACVNDTTAMSLILPSAECDLNLSAFDKGMLNAVTYLGMSMSSFFWGLISDAVGRKIVLIVGFSLDAFFSISVGLVQNFTLLLAAKLLTGFICSGLMAILTSYLAEHHSNVYRGTIIVCSRVFMSSAVFGLSFLAWLIIPRQIQLDLFNGYITLPSWRIFLLASATPSVLALIGLLCSDESPKFLMFQGKNEEALRVLKKIYNMNTGKPKNTFPVKFLRNEMGSIQKDLRGGSVTPKEILRTAWKQTIPIFHKAYLPKAVLACLIQCLTLFCMNTVRLWSPHLFSLAVKAEKYGHNSTAPSTLCELLGSVSGAGDAAEGSRCNGHPVEDKIYFNTMVTGIVSCIGFLISSYIVKICEKKWFIISAYSLSFPCCLGFYWSNTSNILLGVISFFVALMSASSTVLLSIVIDIFPTSLRTTTVSLCMTFGLLGAMAGNMIFPILLELNCTAPFILFAGITLGAAGLSVLLPNTKGKDLE